MRNTAMCGVRLPLELWHRIAHAVMDNCVADLLSFKDVCSVSLEVVRKIIFDRQNAVRRFFGIRSFSLSTELLQNALLVHVVPPFGQSLIVIAHAAGTDNADDDDDDADDDDGDGDDGDGFVNTDQTLHGQSGSAHQNSLDLIWIRGERTVKCALAVPGFDDVTSVSNIRFSPCGKYLAMLFTLKSGTLEMNTDDPLSRLTGWGDNNNGENPLYQIQFQPSHECALVVAELISDTEGWPWSIQLHVFGHAFIPEYGFDICWRPAVHGSVPHLDFIGVLHASRGAAMYMVRWGSFPATSDPVFHFTARVPGIAQEIIEDKRQAMRVAESTRMTCRVELSNDSGTVFFDTNSRFGVVTVTLDEDGRPSSLPSMHVQYKHHRWTNFPFADLTRTSSPEKPLTFASVTIDADEHRRVHGRSLDGSLSIGDDEDLRLSPQIPLHRWMSVFVQQKSSSKYSAIDDARGCASAVDVDDTPSKSLSRGFQTLDDNGGMSSDRMRRTPMVNFLSVATQQGVGCTAVASWRTRDATIVGQASHRNWNSSMSIERKSAHLRSCGETQVDRPCNNRGTIPTTDDLGSAVHVCRNLNREMSTDDSPQIGADELDSSDNHGDIDELSSNRPSRYGAANVCSRALHDVSFNQNRGFDLQIGGACVTGDFENSSAVDCRLSSSSRSLSSDDNSVDTPRKCLWSPMNTRSPAHVMTPPVPPQCRRVQRIMFPKSAFQNCSPRVTSMSPDGSMLCSVFNVKMSRVGKHHPANLKCIEMRCTKSGRLFYRKCMKCLKLYSSGSVADRVRWDKSNEAVLRAVGFSKDSSLFWVRDAQISEHLCMFSRKLPAVFRAVDGTLLRDFSRDAAKYLHLQISPSGLVIYGTSFFDGFVYVDAIDVLSGDVFATEQVAGPMTRPANFTSQAVYLIDDREVRAVARGDVDALWEVSRGGIGCRWRAVQPQ